MKHHRVYRLLKNAGHSPIKALEIIFDARRNDKDALTWIKVLFIARRSFQ